jgi:hypothetical protein
MLEFQFELFDFGMMDDGGQILNIFEDGILGVEVVDVPLESTERVLRPHCLISIIS